MASLAELNVLIGADLGKFDKDLRKAQTMFKKNARALQQIGDGIFNKISVPFGLAAAAGVKFSSDLEANFSKIQNLVGVTGSALEDLKRGVESLSGKTGKSQQELSDALFTVTSAGLRGADALAVLEKAAKSSAVGMGNTKEVARALTSVVQAYGKENISVARAAEIMFKTIKEGNLDAESLAPALGQILPIASSLKVSFGELGANVASFTKLGVSAPQAVTALRSALSAIVKPSEEGKKALASVGLSIGGLKESIKENGLAATFNTLLQAFKGNEEGLAKFVGRVEGLNNILGTAGAQGEDYVRIAQEMEKETDLLGAGFDEAAKTSAFTFQQALEDLRNAAIKVGDQFAPVAKDIASALSGAAKSFSTLDKDTLKSILSMTAFAAGTGVALKGASIFTRGLADLAGGMRGMTQLTKSAFGQLIKLDSAFRGTSGAGGQAVGVFGSLKTAVKSTATAFKGLHVATKLTVVGLALGAVVGAIALYKKFKGKIDNVTVAMRAQSEVTKSAEAATASERTKVESLIRTLSGENTARELKEKALRKLKEIAPGHFGNLDLEKGKVEGLTTAHENYTKSILSQAKARAASNQLTSILEEQFEVEKKLEELRAQPKSFRGGGFLKAFGLDNTSKIQDLEKQFQRLEASAQSYADIIHKTTEEGLTGPDPIIPTFTPGGGGGGEGELSKAEEAAQSLTTALDLASKKFVVYGNEIDFVKEKTTAYQTAISAFLTAGLQPVSSEVVNAKRELEGLAAALEALENPVSPFLDMTTQLKELSSATDFVKQDFAQGVFSDLYKEMDLINEKSKLFGSEFDAVAAKMDLVKGALSSLIGEGFNASDPAIQNLIDRLRELDAEAAASFDSLQERTQQFQQGFSDIIEGGLEELVGGLGEAVGDAIAGQAEGASVIAGVMGSLAGVLGQLGKLAIATGIAVEGIKESFKLNPIGAIIGGAALLALSKVVKAKAASLATGGGGVALAQGGLVHGPTLALVGDNPGAQFDPEVVSPLSKLQGMLQQNVGVSLEGFRISGLDLVAVLNRAQSVRNRL